MMMMMIVMIIIKFVERHCITHKVTDARRLGEEIRCLAYCCYVIYSFVSLLNANILLII